jgi:hypothetical protein
MAVVQPATLIYVGGLLSMINGILTKNRGLSGISGNLLYIFWDQIPGECLAHAIQQVPTTLLRNLEMGCATHPIQLVKVIGQDASGKKLMAQLDQGLRRVVYLPEEHRLVEQDHAGILQGAQGVDQLLVDFVGVIDVQHKYHAEPGIVYPLEQLGCDALGQDNGQAGMNP